MTTPTNEEIRQAKAALALYRTHNREVDTCECLTCQEIREIVIKGLSEPHTWTLRL